MNKIVNQNIDTEEYIREFILDDHPCVMAQSLVADDNLTIRDYGSLNRQESHQKILEDLELYIEDVDSDTMKFQTFIATFADDYFEDELTFENELWKFLHALHLIDPKSWDRTTSADTESAHFSFSLLGISFYIVGMHPKSSREARSTPFPMIVFNLHSQFEMLRGNGRYDRVRDLIRRRDREKQGSINPMLEDFGSNSEARQYSGRAVEKDWKCPYNFKKTSDESNRT